MNNAFRISSLVCILIVFGLFVGCSSDDDPVIVDPPIEPPVETNLGGTIGIYADEQGTNSRLIDTGGIVTFYVVHKIPEGGTAAAFKIEAPAGWTRIGAVPEFPVSVGSVDEGVAIGYGRCVRGTCHVMTLTYQSPGNTPAGTVFKVLPHDEFPTAVQVVDCNETLVEDGIGEESMVMQARQTPEAHRETRFVD
jgi:hypothetical protein